MSKDVKTIFEEYAAFGANRRSGTTLDNAQFFKLIKESNFIDEKFTRPQVDLLFQKVMLKERKMNFEKFSHALELLAKNKNTDLTNVQQQIIQAGGPKTNHTTTFANDDWVKKQTNVENYTGIHKLRFAPDGSGRGREGRDSMEAETGDLTQILDRSPADLRGRKITTVQTLERQATHQKKITE